MPDTGVVAGDREILGALLDQAVDQSVRLTDGAEPAEQDDRAVLDTGHHIGHRLDDLVDHARRFLERVAPGGVAPGTARAKQRRFGAIPKRNTWRHFLFSIQGGWLVDARQRSG